MSTPATPKPTSVVDELLTIFQLATAAASLVPGAGPFAAVALKLEQIAQAAERAHTAITGQPFDASKIPAIDPL